MSRTIFAKFNSRAGVILGLMLSVFIVNGIIQLAAVYSLYGEIHTYENAARTAKDIELQFQKQSEIWREVILDGDRTKQYREYYYEMSKHSDRVADALYNLKILFADDGFLPAKTGEVLAAHKDFTNHSVALIFGMESMKEAEIERATGEMNRKTGETLGKIEEIVLAIGTRADMRIADVQKRYAAFIAGGAACGTGLFIALMIMFFRVNRNAQRKVVELSSTLTSYLPPQFVRAVSSGDSSVVPAIARKYITVCFTDLEGFTAASEGCEPEMIARILNEYLSDMATIAQSRGGMVDKFMGDGIMIVFGAFTDDDDADIDARASIDMAVTMQMRMTELVAKWRSEGFEAPLGLRVGINTGYAALGSIGPEDRRSFTAIGSAVNIASRLEKLCAPGKILIGYDTRVKVCGQYECVPRVEHKIKGLSRSIHVFEIDPDGEHMKAM